MLSHGWLRKRKWPMASGLRCYVSEQAGRKTYRNRSSTMKRGRYAAGAFIPPFIGGGMLHTTAGQNKRNSRSFRFSQQFAALK